MSNPNRLPGARAWREQEVRRRVRDGATKPARDCDPNSLHEYNS